MAVTYNFDPIQGATDGFGERWRRRPPIESIGSHRPVRQSLLIRSTQTAVFQGAHVAWSLTARVASLPALRFAHCAFWMTHATAQGSEPPLPAELPSQLS